MSESTRIAWRKAHCTTPQTDGPRVRCLQCGAPIERLAGSAFCSRDCRKSFRIYHPPAESRGTGWSDLT